MFALHIKVEYQTSNPYPHFLICSNWIYDAIAYMHQKQLHARLPGGKQPRFNLLWHILMNKYCLEHSLMGVIAGPRTILIFTLRKEETDRKVNNSENKKDYFGQESPP
jgi:hypothetical protein